MSPWIRQIRIEVPKKLEAKLKKRANKKNLSKSAKNAYVYGTLRKTGWKPSKEK